MNCPYPTSIRNKRNALVSARQTIYQTCTRLPKISRVDTGVLMWKALPCLRVCQRQGYKTVMGMRRFPRLSGDETCLLKKKKSAPLSFISNMVRRLPPIVRELGYPLKRNLRR